jgi:hypothetical protein
LQRNKGGNVFNGIIVFVHAYVGEEVHKVQEVVPFGPPVFEILGDGAEVILV